MKSLAAICVSVGVFFLASGVPAAPLDEAGLTDLLEAVHAARSPTGIQADYHETRHLALLKEPIIEEGTLAFRSPNSFRKEARAPARSLTLSDGKTLWIVFPDEGQAEKYRLDSSATLRDSFAALAAAFHLEDARRLFEIRAESQTNGSRIELTPRKKSLRQSVRRILITVDARSAVREIRIESPNGNFSVLTLLNERPAKFKDADFQFTPPPGMAITEPLG